MSMVNKTATTWLMKPTECIITSASVHALTVCHTTPHSNDDPYKSHAFVVSCQYSTRHDQAVHHKSAKIRIILVPQPLFAGFF